MGHTQNPEVFTSGQMRTFIEERFDEILEMFDAKGNDYAQNDDAFDNFKTAAEQFTSKPIDKYDVWSIYFFKHHASLTTWLNDRDVKSEPIQGRVLDLILYLLIFWAMVEHDENADRSESLLGEHPGLRRALDSVRKYAKGGYVAPPPCACHDERPGITLTSEDRSPRKAPRPERPSPTPRNIDGP